MEQMELMGHKAQQVLMEQTVQMARKAQQEQTEPMAHKALQVLMEQTEHKV